jgi:hypothetical protein
MALKAYGAKIPMVRRLVCKKELFRFLVFTFSLHLRHKEDTFESGQAGDPPTPAHPRAPTPLEPLKYTFLYNMKKWGEKERERG